MTRRSRILRNEDPLDLARSAKVTASAEEPQAQAALLLDGLVRNIPDKKGDPAQWHCWSAPMKPEGQWIELSWDKPQSIRRVQVTFDSGFQRQLTLSASDKHIENSDASAAARDGEGLCTLIRIFRCKRGSQAVNGGERRSSAAKPPHI